MQKQKGALFCGKQKMNPEFEGVQKAKTLRESADYYDQWSKTGVETILKVAEEFLDKSTQLINGINDLK